MGVYKELKGGRSAWFYRGLETGLSWVGAGKRAMVGAQLEEGARRILDEIQSQQRGGVSWMLQGQIGLQSKCREKVVGRVS